MFATKTSPALIIQLTEFSLKSPANFFANIYKFR